MMPIFFHSEAHLWIAYALFFNGLLLNRILLKCSHQYQRLCEPFEAQIVMSFGLSLGLNGVILLALDVIGASFDNAWIRAAGSSQQAAPNRAGRCAP